MEGDEMDAQPQQFSADRTLLEAKMRLEARARSGSRWFYWLAGLSLLNSVFALTGGTWSFLFGMAITQVIDGISIAVQRNAGLQGFNLVAAIALGLDFLVALVVVVFGYFAGRGNRTVYVVGMILYALDAVVTLIFQDWLGFVFHVIVLVGLWSGFAAMRKLAAA
jgi:hypothetical protein